MIERRVFTVSELRVEGKNEPVISGHAAVFNQKSEEIFGISGMREIVKPGAFSSTIKKDDIRALWNHDPNFVLGRRKNGTLELSEDKIGLRVRISPPDTIFANDILESIRRGDVDQMSFGFRTITDEWRKQDGETLRELHEVELFDVSPVTFPAYPQTDVSVRSYFESKIRELSENNPPQPDEKFLKEHKEREEFLARRTIEADPLSFREIIKRCRINP